VSMRARVRPWMEWGIALPSLGMTLLSLTLLPERADVGLPMAGLFVLVAAAFGWLGWQTWVDVVVEGAQIHLRRGGKLRTLPSASVRAVQIRRARSPLLPTTVYLRVPGERLIPVARYALRGRGVLARAEALQAALGVPLLDPVGAQLRGSRLAPLRWRAAGDEWAYLLCLVMLALPLLVAGVVAQLR
jgi:hypothetical protein